MLSPIGCPMLSSVWNILTLLLHLANLYSPFKTQLPELPGLCRRPWHSEQTILLCSHNIFHIRSIPEGLMRCREGPEKLSSTSSAAFLPPTTLLVPTENVTDSSGGQASSRKNYHGRLIQQKNIWCKSMTVNPRISLSVLNFWPTAARPTTDYQEGTLTRF